MRDDATETVTIGAGEAEFVDEVNLELPTQNFTIQVPPGLPTCGQQAPAKPAPAKPAAGAAKP